MTDPAVVEFARELLAAGILTDRQFEAWKLCKVNGLSQRTIALGLGLAKSTVKERIDRAQQLIDLELRRAA